MSITEMPVPPTGTTPEAGETPVPQEDEALVGVILEVVVAGLPELLKQDPAFKAAMMEALGLSSGDNAPQEEGDEDMDALLGLGEDEDESIDALLEGFEGIEEGADFESLG